ncbi:RICIN domain-containing protein [Nonomuraea endophytica]|uniref:Uncharacterized protein n=1 Tax=Nonomuraea endophytica TaxID=714136 RepID=A0A7W8EGW4_9ACTN|nr:RICIN domain-containing protein [Nonomuraea endophytica]MBB5078836.1 hypothetical protein [Nonomuraea endophytica]
MRATSVVLVTAATFLTGTTSAVSRAARTLIGNIHSGKRLEILGWSTADWARAGQWTCHGGNNQR